MEETKKLKVAVIGAGLVGTLEACFLARRGHLVEVFEARDDLRNHEGLRGRSINLAMSARGRTALRQLGLEDTIINKHGIPMMGRMVHCMQGGKRPIIYDPLNKQCIYSVNRRHLNHVLLTAAEKYPNVSVNFNHKLVEADLEKRLMTFRANDRENVTRSADLIVGADGSHSAVRRYIIKQSMFDYSQNYIEHGYIELNIPAGAEGQSVMELNYLHVWPRSTFMMIALPNQDYSWTVTLFMPFTDFEKIKCEEELIEFFSRYFPDSIPLIGKDLLIKDFFGNKPYPLISIKCKPYHLGSSAIIIGDAAHAMVPFYGQGMNAGFEDCYLLDQLMNLYKDDMSEVLPRFTEIRHEDATVICDLAMYNYLEMRDLVNRKIFLVRKKLDEYLYRIFPNLWTPLYISVTFSNVKYSRCQRNKQWQDQMIWVGSLCFAVFITMVAAVLFLY